MLIKKFVQGVFFPFYVDLWRRGLMSKSPPFGGEASGRLKKVIEEQQKEIEALKRLVTLTRGRQHVGN
jgi:hypothetical protein